MKILAISGSSRDKTTNCMLRAVVEEKPGGRVGWLQGKGII